jgi:hypothetical protein
MSELPSSTGGPHVYPMAPLIRSTLVLLYLALVLPLPAFAAGAMRLWLLVMVVLGLVLVLALVSERVELSAEGVRVGPAPWCASVIKRGWQLSWGDVKALVPVGTSQGGRVYYIRGGSQAHLLPQRVERFDDFLVRFSSASGVDTSSVQRLTPPWTYQLLAISSGLMLAIELLAGLRWITQI